MARKQQDSSEGQPSGGLSSSNVPIRKVQPVNTPDDEGSETPAEGIPGGGNWITNAKDLLGQAGGTAFGAIKSGMSALGGSWFGLKPVVNGVSSGVGKVAGSLNVSKRLAGGVIAALVMVGGAGVGVTVANNNFQAIMLRQDDYEDDCSDEFNSALTSGYTGSVADADAQMQEYAEKLWAWGQAYGLNDYQCAGMLGNMQVESGIDPTSIEGVYNEPYQIGSQKQSIFGDGTLPNSAMNSWVTGHLASTTKGITLSAYLFDGSNYCCGLGLIQWTGPRGKGLVDYADGLGRDWYDLAVQVARIMAESSGEFEAFQADSSGAASVTGATAAWYGYMEAGKNAPYTGGYSWSAREQYAEEWYARLSSRSSAIETQYSEFANDVIELAGTTVTAANGKHATALDEECDDSENKSATADNSSLAAAAVAYAWETKDMGNGNNGTQLYQTLLPLMYGDYTYQSCDRGVACAVAWSGADDNFPVGITDDQDAYMASHPELWEFVGTLESCVDELQPGDILVTTAARKGTAHGHIVMYVGNEAIQEKYPGATGEIVSASLNSRSPGCGDYANSSTYLNQGYYVYRYIGDYSGTKKSLYTGSASGIS